MTELDRRTLLRTGLVVGAGAAGGALLRRLAVEHHPPGPLTAARRS
ncbi:hypothetical protein ACLQ3B_00045 [Micromonospora sp. DT53]